jgi:hypothetical protein
MAKPLVVSIPHQLGKQEALSRIKGGLERAQQDLGHFLKVDEATWSGDTLSFRVSALMQQASGTVDVAEDVVTISVELPLMLAMLASAIQAAIEQRGALLLEKK